MATNEYYIQQINDNPFIANNSKATYLSNIKTIMSKCKTYSIHSILMAPSTYGPMLIKPSANTSINTQHSHMTTILSFLKYSGLKFSNKALFTEWYKEFDKIMKLVKHREDNNIPSEKQKRTFIEWSCIIKKRDEMQYGSIEHVLLSLYTYVPPRRQQDYTNLRIYTNPEQAPELSHNHFHTCSNKYKTAYMYLNEVKNVKSFFNKEIPKELVNIINYSIQQDPRDYLFVQSRNGFPFKTANSFQKYSNTILKKIFQNEEMSVNVLRHSFATFISKQYITVGERKKIAIQMGHSLKKNLEYAFITQ